MCEASAVAAAVTNLSKEEHVQVKTDIEHQVILLRFVKGARSPE